MPFFLTFAPGCVVEGAGRELEPAVWCMVTLLVCGDLSMTQTYSSPHRCPYTLAIYIFLTVISCAVIGELADVCYTCCISEGDMHF